MSEGVSVADCSQQFNALTTFQISIRIVNGSTYVYGDTNGDGSADFMIRMIGEHALTSGDFVI